ncbi:LysR family transcriptional regulator [Delftia sp. PS-11]|uniref:LysR family transcriptional regulator n=1 Tax=Delftia sp. PS-11 TaxID=2767222 RepID=UPI0024557C6B|nr:LysR family transcriptional regulator [Delftia sp. PS-11]KAJ8746407.1 LysR family transcriptional regulator [Delftia sp. PS-11]
MRRMIPNTAALTAFEAAARHSNFTVAANELSLTQGAICRQIASLEAVLRTKLFRRAGRGVVLTEAGVAYRQQVAGWLDAIERETLNLMARQGRGGTIELAVVPTFGTRWLLPRLSDFAREHPDITVNLSSRTRPFLFEESTLDASIYAGDGNWPGAAIDYLMPENMVPVCSPKLLGSRKHLTPEQIAQLPLIQQSTRPYAWRHWFESVGLRPQGDLVGPRYELFSMSLQAAAVGLGVALVPEYDLADEIAAGRLVIPFKHHCPSDRAYYFAIPESKSTMPQIAAFRTWLMQQTQGAR